MKKAKKLISALIVITMVFTMIPVLHIPVYAEPDDIGVQFVLDTAPNGAYKLVFKAKTSSGIKTFGIVFSFDNTVIKPVNRANQSDVAITDGATTATPFLVLAEDIELTTMSAAPRLWKVDGTRTAFNEYLYTTEYVESSGSYVDMFEFYFKFQDGKNINDIDINTFRFENGSQPGNFVSKYFVSDEGAGISLSDNNSNNYLWGAINQTAFPNSIDEVINPFIIDKTPPVPGNSGTITTASITQNSLTLNWTKAADNVTAEADLKYYVYQKSGTTFTMSGGLPTDGTLLNTGGTADIATYNVTSLASGTTYYFIVVVEDEAGNKAAYTAVSATTLTYTATINPTSKMFDTATVGYSNAAMAQQFTITNTGTGQITGLSASLGKGASSDFEISISLSATSIAPGGTATISVRPKNDRAPNTSPYTDTLTITGNNGISLPVSLSFTVTKATVPSPPTGAVTVLYNDTASKTVDIAALVSGYAGTKTYQVGSYNTSVIAPGATVPGGNLTFNLVSGLTSSAAGSYTIPVTVGGLTDYNDFVVNVTVTVTDKPTVTVIITAPAGVTYGTPLGDPSATSSNSETNFTYSYSGTLANGTSYGPTATKPSNPGTYSVTATLVSDTHAGISDPAAFTISKKDLTWDSNGTVNDKIYDGVNTATVNAQPTLSGVESGDTVTASGTATFNSVNANGSIAVTASNYTIGGTDAWKYNAPVAQPSFSNAAITKKSITITGAAITAKTYDGGDTLPTANVTSVTFTGAVTGGTALTMGTTYNVTAAAYTGGNYNAGNNKPTSITVALAGDADTNYTLTNPIYTGATAEITKKSINITGAAISPKTYDGTAAIPAANVTAVTFNEAAIGTNYTVTAAAFTGGDYNVGNNKPASVTVQLTGTAATNYSLTNATYSSAAADITKASAAGVAQTIYVRELTAGSYTFDLTKLLPQVASPMTLGTVTYTPAIGINTDFLDTLAYVSGDTLTIPVLVTAIGTATVEVAIDSDNFTVSDATITIEATDKSPVGISGVSVSGRAYDGSPAAVSGTPVFTDTLKDAAVTSLTPVYTWSSGAAPSDAGSYTLTVSADGGTDYDVADLVINFTITQATIEVTADDKTAKAGDPEPAYTYTETGRITGDDWLVEPTVSASPDMNAAGGYTIIASGGDAGANYIVNYSSGILTVGPLGTDCDVITVNEPSGAAINGTDITADVSASAESVTVDVSVSADASWKLFGDAACTDEITDKVMDLSVGDNTAYIEVTAENPSVKKIYTLTVTRPAVTTYTVTVNGSYDAVSGAGDYAQGETVTINAGSRSGYSFDGWTVTGGAALDNANSAATTFTMPANDVTLTANWRDTGGTPGGSTPGGGDTGGGGGGGSGGGSSTPPKQDPPPETTTEPTIIVDPDDTVQGTINGKLAEFTKNDNGGVSLALTEDDIQDYPQKEGSGVCAIGITGQDDVQISVPISALADSALQIKTDSGTITLTQQMLAAYQAKYGDTLVISVVKTDGGFTVQLLSADGEPADYDDPENPLIVSIPVAFDADASGGYVAVKKDASGDVVIPLCAYKDGEIIFRVSGTGTFGYIYNAKTFGDTAGHWAAGYIAFASSHNLFQGVGGDLFSPDTSMTRAMFAQVIANIEGVDLSLYAASRFTDVAADAWYAPAVEWAASVGIVTGYGDGLFGPNDNISREQMAVILAKYIAYKGYDLPMGPTAAFADEGDISSWAKEAVAMMQAAGLISGRPGGIYDPKGTATRAEVATIFARFIEIYINHLV